MLLSGATAAETFFYSCSRRQGNQPSASGPNPRVSQRYAGMAFKYHITCHAAWQIECALDEPLDAR